MRKVLFVILGLDFSGAENVLIQYLDGNSEIDPYFAFIYEGNAAQHFSEKFGASKVYQLKLSYIKNELRFLPKITQYRLKRALMTVIEQLRPDTLYFNNTHEVILSRKIVRGLKVPCIGHVHDMQESIGTVCKRYEAKRAFDELGLHRIYFGTHIQNIRMQRLGEKLGFQKEGVFKDAQYKNGKYNDIIQYALIANDYK